jgi:hypothetical protein
MIDALLDPCPWLAAGGVLLLGLMGWLALWAIESHYRKLEDEERRSADEKGEK